MRRTLFALALALAVAAPALTHAQARPTPQSANEQSVRKFIEEYAAALSSSDVPALDRMMAPDYSFVNQAGVIQNKAIRLAPLRSRELKYERVSYDQLQVHLFGGTAVVTARVKVKGANKGADVSGTFRSTLTLVRGADDWRLVASQSTTITP